MRPIDFFDNGCDLNPEAVCFVQDDTERNYSYAEIREITVRVANGLIKSGFKKGMRGAVLSINDPIAFTCALSFLRAGLAWVPINPNNALEENIFIMDEFGCEVLFYHSIFEKYIPAIKKQVAGIRLFVCIDKISEHSPFFSDWVQEYPCDEVSVEDNPDDLMAIMPTGGTTGLPKGVRHTNRSMSAMIMSHLAVTFYDEIPPVYLAAAPMTHAGGYICFPILARGGKIVVPSKIDPDPFLAAIPKHRVTSLFLPPTVIYVFLNMPTIKKIDFSSLKYFIYGAAPMSPDKLKEAMDIFGPVMMQMFGQTECCFPITYLPPEDHVKAIESGDHTILASCGRAAPYSHLAIIDEEGKLLNIKEVGEIVVRTPMVMSGYHKNPELSAEISAYGWHHTGDVGYRDKNGYFYIVDRKKDMIISGGFNIFSTEVERAVMSNPAVKDCAVIGIPHEKWGEAVKAVVELREGCSVTEEELIRLCKEIVGSVKTPKSVDFVDELPRSANGKVLKKNIRAKFWPDTGRKVN